MRTKLLLQDMRNVEGNNLLEAKKNFERAGYFFMSSTWVQSVMVDLTVLKENPEEVQAFVETCRFSENLAEQRTKLWREVFGAVKDKFFCAFEEAISEDEKNVFEGIQTLRNILAHSRVSTGKSYLLHAPQNANRLRRVMRTCRVISDPNEELKPDVIKLDLANEEICASWDNILNKTGDEIFPRLSESINVPLAKIC